MYEVMKTVAAGVLLLHAGSTVVAAKSASDVARRRIGKFIAGVCLLGGERNAE
jgi:hypothetical protein